MSSLYFQLISITDGGLRADVTVDANSLRPEGVEPLPLDDVTVQGQFTPMMEQYLFQGTVEGVFRHACDRCLEPAELPVSLPVVWTFEEGPPKDYLQQLSDDATVADDEVEAFGVFTYQGTAIDLARPVWDEISLAAPVKIVCRDDCRGLCPVCGGNRNTAPCTCEENIVDETPVQNSGFAGLKDLFPDLPK